MQPSDIMLQVSDAVKKHRPDMIQPPLVLTYWSSGQIGLESTLAPEAEFPCHGSA